MGNNPSAPSKSPSTASPASSHGTSAALSRDRREPKLRDNIQSHRVAAPPEPSLAQARGTNVTHRSRPSQSHHAPFDGHSQSPQEQSKASGLDKLPPKDEPSKPVPVPQSVTASSTLLSDPDTKSPYSNYQGDISSIPTADTMSYHLTRPPRLPLPIEEEVHTPGSPILGPADMETPMPEIESLDVEEIETLPRRLSALSETTIDEEEDAEELPIDKTKPVVPTEFVWLGGGEKVYVTGTIFQWSRKSKLYPIPGRPGAFSAIIHVRPGTHHIRFIVDGNMTISPDLPTTVDFGNNLVNYIEVSADDLPKEELPHTEAIDAAAAQEHKDHPSHDAHEDATPETKPAPRTKPVLPQSQFTSVIPQYLLDLDEPEDSAAYKYAAQAIVKLPTPPSLPGFLGKPILNAATPMKDDNSVLNMPNHTVLNHLATSSIKNNVLAVSATTRYKRKYVTTIMYKPTSDDTS